jgi:hypothetical protein
MAPHSGGVAVDAVLDEAEQMRLLLVGLFICILR